MKTTPTSRGYCRDAVKADWIRGEADLEIPWLGLIRLYFNAEMPDYTPMNSIVALVAVTISTILLLVAIQFTFSYMDDRGIRPWASFKKRLRGRP